MLEAERQQQICTLVAERGLVGIHTLRQVLQASEATLRRDLARLDRAGRIRRVRGGAGPAPSGQGFDPYRHCVARPLKQAIATAALRFVNDGDTICVDAGSTTSFMAEGLRDRHCTVLTNSFPLAQQLMVGPACKVILTPGEIDRQRGAVLDPFDDDFLAHYACTTLFMSAQSIDELGIHNDDGVVIRTEQAMLRIARKLVLLVDSRKFRQQGNLRLCGWGDIHAIITDGGISAQQRALVEAHGVRLIIV